MYSAKDTEASKLEVFKQNEKWQKVIEEFLGAWKEFYDIGIGLKLSWKEHWWRFSSEAFRCYSIENTCLSIRRYDSYWDYTICARINAKLRIFNVRRTWIGLRKYTEVARFEWRNCKKDWQVKAVNHDHLPDIIAAIRLLRERTVDAEDVCNAHEDNMEILNDYLDGLAEVL